MRYLMKLMMAFLLSMTVGALLSGAYAAVKSRPMRKASGRVAAYGGEGLRRKRNLEFDGRSVESLKAGNYDSAYHLGDGEGNPGAKRIYSLPTDFRSRMAESETEMRYRP